MKSPSGFGASLILGVLWLGSTPLLQAADPIGGNWGICIYSNSFNDSLTRFNPGTREVGDQIMLADTRRFLTYFDFEYWGIGNSPTTFAGDVQAQVRFYLNNGTLFNGYSSPGDMFYESTWFSLTPSDRATVYFTAGTDFPTGGLWIPADEFTWSVQFQGMGATDTVGVDLYSPPTIGDNYPDYWENTDNLGSWTLLTNGVPIDFGARMYGVPEPSSLVLSLVGGLGILVLARRLRRAD